MPRFLKILFSLFLFVAIIPAFFLLKNQQTWAQTSSSLVCSKAQADVILSIDRSGSMRESSGRSNSKMNAAKVASRNFINTLAKDTRNHVGVVSFATQSTVDQNLTSNYDAAKNAVNSLSANGSTCVECGIYKSKIAIRQGGRNGVKKVVIFLTDGRSNVIRGSSNSRVSENLAERKALEELKKAHGETGVIFYTIGLGTKINSSFLKKMANITGGKYFASPTTDQLDTIYQQISQIVAEGSISGVVFNDINGNGIQDGNEEDLEGWTLQLSANGQPTKSITTDVSGGYVFGELCEGNYTLTLIPKAGWEQTSPTNPNTYSINLTGGNSLTNNNFGVKAGPSPTSIPQCEEKNPALEVTPDTIIGEAGQEKTFTVKVTNNDSQACNPANVNLDAVSFNNPLWDLSLEEAQFVLNPGASGETNLKVTPPSDAVDGPKTITVSAQKVGGVQLTQNVRYVVVNPDPTPTPSPSPTFTPAPTNTPAPTLIPTQTPTFTPTPSPMPSPTPLPQLTLLSLVVGADGIGNTPRIPLGGNKNPLHPNRTFLVSIFDTSDNSPVYSTEQTFTYSSSSEKFEGGFTLPSGFQTGTYNVFVEGSQYLRTQFPGSATITAGQTRTLSGTNFNLIAGDINKLDQSFNSIDLLDYNVLISCSIYAQSTTACEADANYKTWSDLNDDGIVDEDDYTLWLKELANQPGIPLP